jgi:hypothetical protein
MNDGGPFSIPAVRELIRRVGVLRVAGWFVAINLPVAVFLSAVIALRGNQPGTLELVLRGALVFALVGAGNVLFVWLIWRARKGNKTLPDRE